MELSGRKREVWEEIERWENSYFIMTDENPYYSLEKNFNKYLEGRRPETQRTILQAVDSIIFHTHALIQNSKFEQETITKVLDQGRVFADIKDISDMKKLTLDQLRYLTNQHLAKQRLLAFTQGGITGIGSFPFLALDLPLLLFLNLRSIQLTAMTYGYDLRTPFEMMLAVNLFHASTLPKTLQKQGWENLLNEVKSFENEWLVFEENINHKFAVWLQQPLKQLAKGMVLFLFRKKLVQGIPVLGISLGAATNYYLAKQVSEFAHYFYQKRYLIEAKNN